MKMLVIALTFVSLAAFADDQSELAALETSAKISGAGMCDKMASTLIRFKVDGYEEMLRFDPIGDTTKTFYILKQIASDAKTYEYFVKEKGETEEDLVVSKLNNMEWYMHIRMLSPSFANFVFFSDKPTDCTISAQ